MQVHHDKHGHMTDTQKNLHVDLQTPFDIMQSVLKEFQHFIGVIYRTFIDCYHVIVMATFQPRVDPLVPIQSSEVADQDFVVAFDSSRGVIITIIKLKIWIIKLKICASFHQTMHAIHQILHWQQSGPLWFTWPYRSE